MSDERTLSLAAAARAVRDRRYSSVELTREALARAKAVHEMTNAIIAFDDEAALRSARLADDAIAAGRVFGPLHGVPLAHKDMFDRRARIPSWGAKIRRSTPCETDATVIARLEAAGSHQIAALHMTEFAFGPTGHNYVLGHARNPWSPDHITGGSSSGSAILVATGVVPAALGSDTAGSLRLPAAACGVTSLKPTYTRVSRAGAMPLSASLDCIGPIARHVEDLALMLGLIAGHDGRDETSSRRPIPDYGKTLDTPVAGLRIGVDEALIGLADRSVVARIEDALAILEQAGARRVPVRLADWTTLDQLAQLLQLPEVASAHGANLRHRGADFGPQVRARIEFGHYISAADHQTAMRARGTMLARTLNSAFAAVDTVILPTLADPLPTIAELDVAGGPRLQAAMGRVVLYCRPVNYLGLPALTLPYPPSSDLPNGFQLVGRPFAEARLLQLGAAYQKEIKPQIAPAPRSAKK